MSLSEIESVMDAVPEEAYRPKLAEICFIGMMSYFEAFCKDHFASLINICPPLIRNLDINNKDTKINAADLLTNLNHVRRLGFLLSENYDFGSARQINILFQCLLNISPFSSESRKKFESLQRDRNLLVHHGGIYTQRYLTQTLAIKPELRQVQDAAYFDSLVLNYAAVKGAKQFLMTVAKNTVSASTKTLLEYLEQNSIHLIEEDFKAIKFLSWTA